MRVICSMLCCLAVPSALAQTPPGLVVPVTPQAQASSVAESPARLPEREDLLGLVHYREENARLLAPALGVERVIFLGDSITESWSRPGRFFPGKGYLNRGISGQTTAQMLVRFQQDVLALHPSLVVILAGTNDIAENLGSLPPYATENNFRSMVTLAKAAHVRVLLCSVLPATVFPWRPALRPAEDIRALNQWIEGFAREQHVGYLNYYPALVNDAGGMRPDLASDRAVHPNGAGYALMEPLAEAAIARALAQPAP